MTSPALEARKVSAGYASRPVLADVSLAVEPGELCAVIGPNGAGKSTLVRVLAGTLAPNAGSVFLAGQELAKLSRREVSRRLAVVPQDSDVALGFSVAEVVMMGRAPYQSGLLFARPEDERAVEHALERCELLDIRDRPVVELSGGERRRVTIARALAQRTEVLVLDEPEAHLDVRHAVVVCALARREVDERKVACVAVLHDLAAAARWADRVVLLSDGRVRASGTPAEVLTTELLSETYGVSIRVGSDPEGARYFVPDLSK
jgi:iron complex transport system ATP-binding protein